MFQFFGNRKPNADIIKTAVYDALAPHIEHIDIVANGADVTAIITLPADAGLDTENIRSIATTIVSQARGVRQAQVILTAPRKAPQAAPQQQTPKRKAASRIDVPARAIIAVASGKGGVGKSTVAVHVALALQAIGLRVGLLDADIYGPSLPRMLGTDAQKANPDKADTHGRLAPVMAHGLATMSMGYLVDAATPMIWRGPMVQSALRQMLQDVAWPDLDVLVLDMPPGTGDAQLTIAQQLTLAGAVIVSTPQDIALLDARKGLAMFQAVHVPILGIVENMSVFCCPACGHQTHIFGHDGARLEAEKQGVPYLGGIPLDAAIRHGGDMGAPVIISDPTGPLALAYQAIAAQILAALKTSALKPAPRIVIEP